MNFKEGMPSEPLKPANDNKGEEKPNENRKSDSVGPIVSKIIPEKLFLHPDDIKCTECGGEGVDGAIICQKCGGDGCIVKEEN